MWQRFNAQARRVVSNAQQEAARSGVAVTAEHLLMALLRENGSLAARILDRLAVDRAALQAEVDRQFRAPAPEALVAPASPESFSPGAKKAIDLCYEEAHGLRDNSIGTEHLLLGLLRDQEGPAGRTLTQFGVTNKRVRAEIAGLQGDGLQAGPRGLWDRVPESKPWFWGAGGAPEQTLSARKEQPAMWQRFTERARKVVFYAQEEAGRLGENYVSTEHLLLGLVRENDTVAARILDRLGISLGRVRSEIERQVAHGQGRLGQDMQLTPRAKRVIDLAYDEARNLDNNYIGTEHLLLGLIREGEGLAGKVLAMLGVDLDRTRHEVAELQQGKAKDKAGDDSAPAAVPETALGEFKALREFKKAMISFVADYNPRPPRETGPQAGETGTSAEPAAKQPPAPGSPSQRMAPPRGRSALADVLEEPRLRRRDILGIETLTQEEILLILDVAARLKANKFDATQTQFAKGQTLAMLFEKPSLRTRVTFEAGMTQLGGHAIYLEGKLGVRETVPDVARNLDRWIDGIMARTFDHQAVLDLAEYAGIPVINGLSDREHPCQAFADFQTLAERGGGLHSLAGQTLAYVGDGNNVAHSLMLLAAKVGTDFRLTCPEGYDPNPELWQAALGFAAETGAVLTLTHDPVEAVRDADAVYTDVWASMGQEEEAAARALIFAPFQVNAALMAHAKPGALVMHCLPAHRGEEISAEVLDGPQSVVFDQAENRLHAQKAILSLVL